jgi:hypothetical protein
MRTLAPVEAPARQAYAKDPARGVDVRGVDCAVAERPRDLDPAPRVERLEVVAEVEGARRDGSRGEDAQHDEPRHHTAPQEVHVTSVSCRALPAKSGRGLGRRPGKPR